MDTVSKLMAQSYKDWNPGAFRTFAHAFQLPQDKTVKDLSRGMGMKLSLACALAHNPDLLVLDEATAGLDPVAGAEALDTLRLYMGHEGRGILRMSSHITSDLEKIADYIVCIDAGRHRVPRWRRTSSPMWPAWRSAARPSSTPSWTASFFPRGGMRYERRYRRHRPSSFPSRQASRSEVPPHRIGAGRHRNVHARFMLKGEAR